MVTVLHSAGGGEAGCAHRGWGAGPPPSSAGHSFWFHIRHQTSGVERLSLHVLKVFLT